MTDRVPNFLTLENAASRLGVHLNTMRRAVREGRVRAVQLCRGGHWRILADDEGVPLLTARASSRRRA